MSTIHSTAAQQATAEHANDAVHREIITQFAAAWERKDIAALQALVTDDIVYSASVGEEPGTTFTGRDAVLAGFGNMWEHDDALAMTCETLMLCGRRAVIEWKYSLRDGSTVHGVDLLTFRNGRLSGKHAFRKTRS